MSLQDHPVSTIISESNDGCTLIKKSEMFYHVSTGDVILDITCELGYESYNKICGLGRLNGAFNISTVVEIERMFLFFFFHHEIVILIKYLTCDKTVMYLKSNWNRF